MLSDITPEYWALSVLAVATLFVVFWGLDARTHKELAHVDITDKELQTHRLILAASVLMEISLVAMYWFPWQALPFFIAFFITRTAHEFMDELHWHMDRCTKYESFLHLGMWTTVLAKTALLFIWGFFTQYQGIEQLSPVYYFWSAVVMGAMGIIGWLEWKR